MISTQGIYPTYLCKGSNFLRDETKYEKYRNIYERSQLDDLQYSTALIRNELGHILVGYNKKHGSRQIPSGKIDRGETQKSALERELEEEIGVKVKEMTYVGSSKKIFNQISREGHFYDTYITGEIQVKEPETMDTFKWVKFLSANTWLGFGLIDEDQTQILDPDDILQNRHMFAEVYWLENTSNYRTFREYPVSLPTDIDPNKTYIQYRDQTTNTLKTQLYDIFKKAML